MKAIILTAGYGRRMRPLSKDTHKTLLPIGDRLVIDWILDALLANGIRDLTVVTGYRADDIRAHLEQAYPTLDIGFVHNARYAQTNNIYSLALAFEQIPLDDDLLLVEGDLIFGPEVISRLLSSSHGNVALVDRYRSGMDGTVVSVADELVTDVIPPHRQGADFHFADKFKTLNIYRFSRSFCDTELKRLLTYYARTIDDNCYYELIVGVLIYLQRQAIHAAVLDGEPWAEIDDPNDLDNARFTFVPESRRCQLEQAHGGLWNYEVLDFTYLRNMYFPTSAMLSELRNNLATLLQNYSSAQRLLNRKLGYFLDAAPRRLLALNGAAQAFPILRRYFAGRSVLIPRPTFGEYPRMFPDAATYDDSVGIDLAALEARLEPGTVLVLVNPNNPTGSTIPTRCIAALAQRHPRCTVLVDESFIEFSDQPSLVSWLEDHPLDNLLVLKSLSKVLGAPGLRLGYLYSCDASLLEAVAAEIPVWNLSSIAEHYLEILLKHRDALAASYHQTKLDRAALADALGRLPAVKTVHQSGGNFLLVELDCSADRAAQWSECLLRQHGLYVKGLSARFGGRAYWRIAVRLPDENRRFVDTLAAVAGNGAS